MPTTPTRSYSRQNLHRWYQPGTASYSRRDPLLTLLEFPGIVGRGHASSELLSAIAAHPFAYAESQPLRRIDPLGLLSCDGQWRLETWWRLGDPPSAQARPFPSGRRGTALPPANRIPNARGPNPVRTPRAGPLQLIPPGICFCRWNCIPCEGPFMYDPGSLPLTKGLSLHSGRDIGSGDSCLCPQPGPDIDCEDKYMCKAPFPIQFPNLTSGWPFE